jgi:hypothetical protein
MLALSIALESLLPEMGEALVRQALDPRAVVVTLLWSASLYLAMLAVPEPVTKVVAAGLTVVLVGYVGWEALWGLVEGWAVLMHRTQEARTFAEVRSAGEQYSKFLGEEAARGLIMAVTAVLGGQAAAVGRRVRALPRYGQALAHAEAQGVRLGAVEAVEAVAISGEGNLTVLMRGPRGGGAARGAVPLPPGVTIVRIIRHRGGNMQVVLSNGQRWHLTRGMSFKDIPRVDLLGDELQAAAHRIAKKWGPHELSRNAIRAINKAHKQGRPDRALLLEQQARGRWVHEQMKKEFKHLKWNHRGVDVTGPSGQQHHYEVLSGTEYNLGLHGRRLDDVFFRMIDF